MIWRIYMKRAPRLLILPQGFSSFKPISNDDMSELLKSNSNHLDHHSHPHEQGQTHAHRNLKDILTIIEKSDFSAHAKAIAVKIFTVLAQTESKAHGVSVDKVHFHEVGAVDSIVDKCSRYKVKILFE